MGSHHDNPDHGASAQARMPREDHLGPGAFHPGHPRGAHEVREQFIPDLAWPMSVGVEPGYELAAARHNLEQVGYILQRMELDRRDIIQLRDETRALLAELAA
jgi:hypothetical protein